MGAIRRIGALLLGAAAGYAAYVVLQNYGQEHHIEAPADAAVEGLDVVPVATPAAPVSTPVQPAPAATAVPRQDGPNRNPVEAGPAVAPMKDGKVDVTKLADPADFGDWDELGCQG